MGVLLRRGEACQSGRAECIDAAGALQGDQLPPGTHRCGHRQEHAEPALVSLSAVLASLYPVVTIALARALLHERLRPLQVTGAVLVMAGVLLIASR